MLQAVYFPILCAALPSNRVYMLDITQEVKEPLLIFVTDSHPLGVLESWKKAAKDNTKKNDSYFVKPSKYNIRLHYEKYC